MECSDCVRVSTCKVLHEQLEMRCAEKHAAINLDREAFKKEIRDLFMGRSNERAWGIVGKIVIGVGAVYAVLQQLVALLPAVAK